MNKTTLDAVDKVFEVLDASALETEITGKIWKNRKPVGDDDKENVVVNSLSINNLQLQQGLVNVNVHVPNISVRVDGITDTTMPNHERLRELAKMTVDVLDDNWGSDFNFDVQQQVLVQDEVTKSWYINIRLNFYSINISN